MITDLSVKLNELYWLNDISIPIDLIGDNFIFAMLEGNSIRYVQQNSKFT